MLGKWRNLLNQGVNSNIEIPNINLSALSYIADSDDSRAIEIAQLLLNKGADINGEREE